MQLIFNLNSAGLITQRNINNSLLIFVGALLGSVFGLLGTFGVVMGNIEGATEAVQGKIHQRKRLNEVKNARQRIGAAYEHERFRADLTNIETTVGLHLTKNLSKIAPLNIPISKG